MNDFSKFKSVLNTKKRAPRRASRYLSKVERFPLVYFSGDDQQRREQLLTLRERLEIQVKPPGLLFRPVHTNQDYDHLEIRVIDEKEQHIECYLKTLDVLPEVCSELQIPYQKERPTYG